jgi:hypothetical protein
MPYFNNNDSRYCVACTLWASQNHHRWGNSMRLVADYWSLTTGYRLLVSLLVTDYWSQTDLSRLICPDWSVQTDLSRLICPDWSVQTGLFRLICPDCTPNV